MKLIKMIKVISILLIAGAVVSASAYAQNMDVTMDVVKQSDAKNITESVMNRIDLPEPARNAGTSGHRDQGDSMHTQDQRNMDDSSREMQRTQMQEEMDSVRESREQMREEVQDMQNDVREMQGGHGMN
jgi:hypothetical protein